MTRPNPHRVSKPHNTQPRGDAAKMPQQPLSRDPGRAPANKPRGTPTAKGSQASDFK
jgi:hypothetical protein